MRVSTAAGDVAAIRGALQGLLGVRPAVVARSTSAPDGVDLLLEAGPHRFVIGYEGGADRATVALAAERVRQGAARRRGRWVPAVVVPFMGPTGAEACRSAEVSWFDLSGNASIRSRGLHVHVEGKPNRFTRRGRPGNPLAPKGSRVARWLLMHPDRAFLQRDIAKGADVDEGLTSRVMRWLQQRDLVIRDERGAWRPKDPAALLDAWHDAYDFRRHGIVRGILGARSSDEVMLRVGEKLERRRVRHAMTGLAGAWLLTQHATFRVVSVLLRESPPESLLSDLGMLPESRGANLWLVVPNDDAVFLGATVERGLSCAHPLQVYLDLKGHPERAAEAAEEVRRRHLAWRVRA